MQFVDYIPKGKEHAVTKPELCRLTGMDERTVRRTIAAERKRGVPIIGLSSSAGYYVATQPAEVEHFARELTSRALDMLETAELMRRQGNDGEV